MKKSLLLALVVLPCLASALSLAMSEDLMLSATWDFYSENRFSIEASGRGNAGIADRDGLFAAILNPACLKIDHGLQTSAGYSYKTKQPWELAFFPDASEMYFTALHPCPLLGLNYGISDKIQTGLVYYDRKSYRFNAGTFISVDETGEPTDTFVAYDDIRHSTLLMPFSVVLGDYIGLGLGIYADRLTHRFHGLQDITNSLYSLYFRPGLLLGPYNGLSFGLTGGYKTKASYIFGGVELAHSEPAYLGFGIKLESPEMRTSFYFDCNKYWYSDIKESLNDRLDTGFGLEQGFGELALRAGFFTVMDYRRPGSSLIEVGSNDQYFLTGGATYPVGPVEISLSMMDSHILSSGSFKQTQVSCGLNYRINK